jgi:hypothetical protein
MDVRYQSQPHQTTPDHVIFETITFSGQGSARLGGPVLQESEDVGGMACSGEIPRFGGLGQAILKTDAVSEGAE